jgi:hypothetical protein
MRHRLTIVASNNAAVLTDHSSFGNETACKQSSLPNSGMAGANLKETQTSEEIFASGYV